MDDGDGQDAARTERRTAFDPLAVFGETCDPALYVARPVTERLLDEMEAGCVDGIGVALMAAPGLGRTTLLHALARRLGSARQCVYLPYGAVSTVELCRWVLGKLRCANVIGQAEPGRAAPGDELVGVARALQRSGRPLVLMIDDASSLPRETARDLFLLAARSGGALRVAIVLADDAVGSRVVARAGRSLRVVRGLGPLSLDEVRHYVDARLRRAGAPPAVRARFDDPAVAWLQRMSGGVPRRLHALASEWIERGGVPDDLPASGPAARAVQPGGRARRPALEYDAADVAQGAGDLEYDLDDVEIEVD